VEGKYFVPVPQLTLFEMYDADPVRDLAAAAVASATSAGRRRPWLNPEEFLEVVGLDIGKGRIYWHRLLAGEDGTVPLGRVLDLFASFGPDTLVVMERAHLAVPQSEKSLAQPFTEETLRAIYAACEAGGITLRMFPEQHSRKAREWSAVQSPSLVSAKKTDRDDARALAFYVWNNNGTALSMPPTTFAVPARVRYGQAVRARSNIVINAARTRDYAGELFPEVSRLAGDILELMSREADPKFVNKVVAFSLASLVVGRDSSGRAVRFTYQGRAPGARFFLRYVVCSSSVHRRGGVARSNFMHHRFPSFLRAVAKRLGVSLPGGGGHARKRLQFGSFEDHQDEIRRMAHRAARVAIMKAYLAAVEHSAGLPPYEVLDSNTEV